MDCTQLLAQAPGDRISYQKPVGIWIAGAEAAIDRQLHFGFRAFVVFPGDDLGRPLAPPDQRFLRFAGGREITLGDLGAKKGILGGINAVIVGNYLTTLGRPAEADLELLDDLQMPIKALNASL